MLKGKVLIVASTADRCGAFASGAEAGKIFQPVLLSALERVGLGHARPIAQTVQLRIRRQALPKKFSVDVQSHQRGA
jgi:hypothetical protein